MIWDQEWFSRMTTTSGPGSAEAAGVGDAEKAGTGGVDGGVDVRIARDGPGWEQAARSSAVRQRTGSATMREGSGIVQFTDYSFGSIRIDGQTYDRDVVVDRGEIRKRKKGPSKELRALHGHTPLSIAEDIPWKCARLVIGTGDSGSLPVLPEIEEEARRRGVDLMTAPTAKAIEVLNEGMKDTNAVLHLTC
jgi:hypothetical protein